MPKLKIMKRLFAASILLLVATATNAQRTDSAVKRIFFHSSAGLGIPNGDYSNRIGNGFVPETGIEVRVSPHSAIAADLSFAAYRYEQRGSFYQLKNKLNITSLTLFYKYIFGSGRFRPYLRAGGGGSMVSVPTVTALGFVTDIRNVNQTVPQAQGEAGFHFAASRRYTLFAGAAKQWLFDADVLGTQDFDVTVIKIGLITSF